MGLERNCSLASCAHRAMSTCDISFSTGNRGWGSRPSMWCLTHTYAVEPSIRLEATCIFEVAATASPSTSNALRPPVQNWICQCLQSPLSEWIHHPPHALLLVRAAGRCGTYSYCLFNRPARLGHLPTLTSVARSSAALHRHTSSPDGKGDV